MRPIPKTVFAWKPVSDKTALGQSNVHGYFGNDRFIAISSSGGIRGNSAWAVSFDGQTWVPAGGDPEDRFYAKSGVYGGGRYVIAGTSGRIAQSPDAEDWTRGSAPFPAGINALAYGNGSYVAAGNGGYIARSSDLGAWETASPFENRAVSALLFAEGRFFAVGEQGLAGYSEEGETWRLSGDTQTGGDAGATCIASGAGFFVLADNQGNTSYSRDGLTWTAIEQSPFKADKTPIYSICYGKGIFVIAGAKGVLAYSRINPNHQ